MHSSSSALCKLHPERSASSSTNTITHVSKLTWLSRLASYEHLCKLILLELKRFNQEYIVLQGVVTLVAPVKPFATGVTGMSVSRTHIPRDACFPAHISLGMRVSHQGYVFPWFIIISIDVKINEEWTKIAITNYVG